MISRQRTRLTWQQLSNRQDGRAGLRWRMHQGTPQVTFDEPSACGRRLEASSTQLYRQRWPSLGAAHFYRSRCIAWPQNGARSSISTRLNLLTPMTPNSRAFTFDYSKSFLEPSKRTIPSLYSFLGQIPHTLTLRHTVRFLEPPKCILQYYGAATCDHFDSARPSLSGSPLKCLRRAP